VAQDNSVSRACVCVFTKAPIPNQVKTRLLPVITADQACALHTSLTRHCLESIQDPGWHTQIWSTDPADPFFNLYKASCLFQQEGGGLGERMTNAVLDNRDAYDFVVIVGTDCPQIETGMITAALDQLRNGKDVVLGPAEDGGYVLIGFATKASSKALDVFTDINWGTDQVLAQTRARIVSIGLETAELNHCRDIDRPEDLQWLSNAYPEIYASIGVSEALPQSDHEPG